MILLVPEARTANVPDLIQFLLPIYQRVNPTHICARYAQQLRLSIAFVVGPWDFCGCASLRGSVCSAGVNHYLYLKKNKQLLLTLW